MEELLTAALVGSTALRALVDKRINWKRLPARKPLPAITLHRVSIGRLYTMRGRVGLTPYRVQIDCWAGSDAAAGEVKAAVIAVLDTLSAGALQAFLNDDPPDGWDPAEGPDPKGSSDVYRQSLDVQLWHDPNAT